MRREEQTVKGWISEDNLEAFLTVIGWLAGCDFDPPDWDAISMGMLRSDYEANSWYDYEFFGKSKACLRLAKDPGTCVVFVEITLPVELVTRVKLSIDIFAHFHLQEGGITNNKAL